MSHADIDHCEEGEPEAEHVLHPDPVRDDPEGIGEYRIYQIVEYVRSDDYSIADSGFFDLEKQEQVRAVEECKDEQCSDKLPVERTALLPVLQEVQKLRSRPHRNWENLFSYEKSCEYRDQPRGEGDEE